MRTFSGRPWSQREDELRAFIKLLCEQRVRSYLEIGARDGDTFHAVMMALPEGSTGVAVDLPNAAWGRDSRANLELAVTNLVQQKRRCHAVFEHSHVPATVAALGRQEFDAVFIDADHRYEAVQKDWWIYGPMGKLVAFHDIDGEGIVSADNMPVEVPILWRQLKRGHHTREIIGAERGMGIGVLWR